VTEAVQALKHIQGLRDETQDDLEVFDPGVRSLALTAPVQLSIGHMEKGARRLDDEELAALAHIQFVLEHHATLFPELVAPPQSAGQSADWWVDKAQR
jgi:hypothetical protein